MNRLTLPILLTFSLILAACSAAAPASGQTPTQPLDASQGKPASVSSEPSKTNAGDLNRVDQQGAVTVEVTPLNLGASMESLEFNVLMDTHSVDLSMDLAALATLTTDTGVTTEASLWDAPRGGHHVEGKLIFPATKDGKTILAGASKLTLTITNVDVPSRVFAWELE